MADAHNESTPSEKELKAEIKKLSKKLGVEITLGKDRAELTAQLEELRGRAAAQQGAAASSGPTSDPPLTGGARVQGESSSAADDPQAPTAPSADRLERSPIERELEQLEARDEALADRLSRMLDIDVDAELARTPELLESPAGASAIAYLRELAKEIAAVAPRIAEELGRRADVLDRERSKAARAKARAPGTAARGYKVAPDHSVACKRGIVGPGSPLGADDLYAGGIERLEELADKGVLVRT